MLIGNKYKIESEGLNITIFKYSPPSKKKDGTMSKENWYPEAYFSQLEHALDYLVRQGVKETGLKDLKTVIAKIKEVEKEIKEALIENKR